MNELYGGCPDVLMWQRLKVSFSPRAWVIPQSDDPVQGEGRTGIKGI